MQSGPTPPWLRDEWTCTGHTGTLSLSVRAGGGQSGGWGRPSSPPLPSSAGTQVLQTREPSAHSRRTAPTPSREEATQPSDVSLGRGRLGLSFPAICTKDRAALWSPGSRGGPGRPPPSRAAGSQLLRGGPGLSACLGAGSREAQTTRSAGCVSKATRCVPRAPSARSAGDSAHPGSSVISEQVTTLVSAPALPLQRPAFPAGSPHLASLRGGRPCVDAAGISRKLRGRAPRWGSGSPRHPLSRPQQPVAQPHRAPVHSITAKISDPDSSCGWERPGAGCRKEKFPVNSFCVF